MEPTLWVVVRVKPGGVFKALRHPVGPRPRPWGFVFYHCRCFGTLGAGKFAPGLSVWSRGQGFGSGLLRLWNPRVTSTWPLSREALSHPSPSPAGSSREPCGGFRDDPPHFGKPPGAHGVCFTLGVRPGLRGFAAGSSL